MENFSHDPVPTYQAVSAMSCSSHLDDWGNRGLPFCGVLLPGSVQNGTEHSLSKSHQALSSIALLKFRWVSHTIVLTQLHFCLDSSYSLALCLARILFVNKYPFFNVLHFRSGTNDRQNVVYDNPPFTLLSHHSVSREKNKCVSNSFWQVIVRINATFLFFLNNLFHWRVPF